MAKKIDAPVEQRPKLTTTIDDASAQIAAQIEKGNSLLKTAINSTPDFTNAKEAFKRWRLYTADLLRTLFDQPAIADREFRGLGMFRMGASENERRDEHFKDIQAYINSLESIKERLKFFAPSLATPASGPKDTPTLTKRVFVVHGHDEAAKQQVARVIEKLGLEAVILHDKPNQGRTIIEKIEAYSDVGFAVVLLTPCDEGRKAGTSAPTKPRARQNVVLELGYFVGKLGRDKVCPLHTENVEIPSDFDGVVYTPMDAAGAWQIAMARELKAAGYDVDLNKLF